MERTDQGRRLREPPSVSHWDARRVTVAGGASATGSRLVAGLLARGARVRVVDNFSPGRVRNLRTVAADIELMEADLRSPDVARKAANGAEVVVQLAGDGGSRYWLDDLDAGRRVAIDRNVLDGVLVAGCGQLVHAGGAAVYPPAAQEAGAPALREDHAGPPWAPDGLRGMADVIAEAALRIAHGRHRLAVTTGRLFGVYGPGRHESHAPMAMLARGFVGDPVPVWDDAPYVRSWTHVDDAVALLLRAAETAQDAEPVNIASDDAHDVHELARIVSELTGTGTTTVRGMPTAPACQIADTTRARTVLGLSSAISLRDGLAATLEWYHDTTVPGDVAHRLASIAAARPLPAPVGGSRETTRI